MFLLPMAANAYDVEIDGIYYNLDNKNLTAEVTYRDEKSIDDTDSHKTDSYKEQTITIPEVIKHNDIEYRVTTIGKNAFYDCSSIQSVSIPNSVTNFEDFAFYECTGLKSISIPDCVTNIGVNTFSGCTGLKSISIPNSVTNIDICAFADCTNLLSVSIPSSVTTIKNYTFYRCSKLQSIIIPSSVTVIKEGAFEECPKLKKIICYTNSVPSTDEYAFYGLDFENAKLYVPVESIEAYKKSDPWSNFKTILPIETATAVSEVAATDFAVNANGGVICIKSETEGQNAAVYTIGGQLIGSGITSNGTTVISTNLPSGSLAVVKVGEKSMKVTMK